MLSPAPTRFRSRYTGAQIDTLLTSISDKIDVSYIVNDYTGGAGLVASAELAKQLYENSQKLNDPNYIKDLFLSIPNSVIVTQADLDKLNRLAGAFQGSYPNAAARNLSVNTGSFKGGELTFLINDGNGQQELSYWNVGTLTWTKSRLTESVVSQPLNLPTGGLNVVINMDITKFEAGKYGVKCRSGNSILVFELLVCQNGTDTFWTTQGYIGNDITLTSVTSCALTTTSLAVSMTTLPNTTITFVKLMEV